MTGASFGLRFLRGLSGIVTAGLVVLAIGVAVTQYLGHSRGFPVPAVSRSPRTSSRRSLP